MPIRFKYQSAAVAPWSNETTRRFGQSLVEQQRQQDFAGRQLRQQLGARDFQNATSNMSSSLQDLLDNNEITDEPTRRRILGLKGGLDTVMGSGFTDDQRRHYLNQYGQQVAGILANAPAKAPPPSPADDFNSRKHFDKDTNSWFIQDKDGGWSPLKPTEQPKQPEPPPPQPKTMEEDYNFGARKGAFRKDFNSLKQQMQNEADLIEGSAKVKDEDVLQRMQQEWEFEQKALGRQSPSAGALPATTTGASMGTGGAQGNNAWAGIAQAGGPLPAWRTEQVAASEGQPFTYSSTPDVGDWRGGEAAQPQIQNYYPTMANEYMQAIAGNAPGQPQGAGPSGYNQLIPNGQGIPIPQGGTFATTGNPTPPAYQPNQTGTPQIDVQRPMEGRPPSPRLIVQPPEQGYAPSPVRNANRLNQQYNTKLDAMRTPMTPEEMATLDAQTNSSLAETDAILADNQARAAEIKAGYAPRTEALKRQADAMSAKTDRAEAALRGELLPRSPQGERPSSMYDISNAQDAREAEQVAANKAEYDKYKAKKAAGDAALQNPTDPDVNAISNPKTMKQDARKFSSEYQLYKRGGGTLSTRDYITQMAKQGQLSDDLKAQLENNYGMDLSDPALAKVEKQDVLSQQDTVKAEAKTKRDAEANRRKYARGMPIAQQKPASVPPAAVAPGSKYGPTAPAAPPSSTATPPVDEEQRALAQKLRVGDRGTGEIDDEAYVAAWQEWVDKYGNQEEAKKYFEKADELYKSNGGVATDEWQELMRKGRAAQMGPYDQFPDRETAPSAATSAAAPATPGQAAQPTAAPALPKVPKLNFGKLFASAEDDTDRAGISKLESIYDGQSLQVQGAIKTVLSSSDLIEVKKAKDYLKSAGIDVDQIFTPKTPYSGPGRRGKVK